MTAEMVSVDEALGQLAQYPLARRTEQLALSKSLGRRLAEKVVAPFDRPSHALSAMDGYAVRLADVADPGAELRIIGEAPAGEPFTGTVGAGEAVRIFTGSHIPDGADHVVMQEHVTRNGDRAVFHEGYEKTAFIRAAGIDFATGTELLAPGIRITPAVIALAASANRAELEVETRPRVAVIANGDELVPPGTDLEPGQAIDANRPALLTLIERMGGEPIDCGILPDDSDAIARAIAMDADLFLPVGGASVGAHDHMRSAFRRAGFEFVFDKVAVRPGKPCWFAQQDDRRVLGLPGNPASALVCATLFLGPLLGHRWKENNALLEEPLGANGPREHFMRAAVRRESDGSLVVSIPPHQDSSLISTLAKSNALVRRPALDPPRDSGNQVRVIGFD